MLLVNGKCLFWYREFFRNITWTLSCSLFCLITCQHNSSRYHNSLVSWTASIIIFHSTQRNAHFKICDFMSAVMEFYMLLSFSNYRLIPYTRMYMTASICTCQPCRSFSLPVIACTQLAAKLIMSRCHQHRPWEKFTLLHCVIVVRDWLLQWTSSN